MVQNPRFRTRRTSAGIRNIEKSTTRAKTTAFPQVVNADFSWVEIEHNKSSATGNNAYGSVTFGPRSNPVAIIATPSEETPVGRAVRTHELIHAKITPEVLSDYAKLKSDGTVTDSAVQIAEDIRVSLFGKYAGVFDDETYFDESVVLQGVGINAEFFSNQLGAIRKHEPDSNETLLSATKDLISKNPHWAGHLPGKITRETIGRAVLGFYQQPIKADEPFDTTDVTSIVEGIGERLALYEDFDPIQYCLLSRDAVRETKRAARAIIEAIEDGATPSAQVTGVASLVQSCLNELRRLDLEEALGKGPGGETQNKDPEGRSGESSSGQGGEGGQSGNAEDGSPSDDPDDKKEEPKKEEQKSLDIETPDVIAQNTRKSWAATRENSLDKEAIIRGGNTISEATIANILKSAQESDEDEANLTNADQIGVKLMEGFVNDIRGQRSHAKMYQRSGPRTDNLPSASPVLSHAAVEDKRLWPELHIMRPELTRSFKAITTRPGRAALEGSIPQHFNRWFSDRAIMNHTGRRPGGTLLIDVSGSMSWNHRQTLQLIDNCPAMTVAVYSTLDEYDPYDKDHFDDEGYWKGALTIVAKDGKCVPTDWAHHNQGGHGGGNYCDGAALAWLCKQPGPRVWLSDGGVSGLFRTSQRHSDGKVVQRDESTPAHIFDCLRIGILGKVMMTASSQTVRDVFSGRKRHRPMTWEDSGNRMITELRGDYGNGIRDLLDEVAGYYR